MIRPHELRSAIETALAACERFSSTGVKRADERAWHSAQLVLVAAGLDQLESSVRMLELGLANARQQPKASTSKIIACEELLEELGAFGKAARARVSAELDKATCSGC